jgi:hypothetical protein
MLATAVVAAIRGSASLVFVAALASHTLRPRLSKRLIRWKKLLAERVFYLLVANQASATAPNGLTAHMHTENTARHKSVGALPK